jgi:hypothetical protein
LTSRPWMASRMVMNAEISVTTSMASAPRTMLKKRLMLRVFSFIDRIRIQRRRVLPLDWLGVKEETGCGGGHDESW